MTIGELTQIARSMLLLYICLAAPIIVSGMIIGLLVSILQTVTQIQEQSLNFVFKVAVSLGVLIFLSPWMLRKIVDYASGLLGNLDKFVW